jgi:hypothetical protein
MTNFTCIPYKYDIYYIIYIKTISGFFKTINRNQLGCLQFFLTIIKSGSLLVQFAVRGRLFFKKFYVLL